MPPHSFEDVFADGGEMGLLMRSLDWSQTLLGPVSTWAQSLKTAISIILNSRYPMFIWWGKEYANLYNDAYRPILGASKHPQYLGQSAKDCWAEVWDVVGPLADSVLNTGQPTWSDNLRLLMDRSGYLEETYFTFSYSPIRDETGGVGGVFCAVIETTERVIGERRLRTLRELAANTAATQTVTAAYSIVADTLAQNLTDIPFALLYQIESAGTQARLVGGTGITAGTSVTPEQVDLTQENSPWQLIEVKQSKQAKMIESLLPEIGINSASSALVIPIAQSGKPELACIAVLGISRQRAFNDEYQGFFDLVVSNITTAIANAEAYEVERQRAETLAELDRAKTIFFSNISHEFRTPITLMLETSATYIAEALRWLPTAGNRAGGTENRENQPHLQHLASGFSSGRILLVDDNADMREYVQRLLSLHYQEVIAVEDGIAALATIRHTMPDIVITDIMMPRLDGFGLVKELRADPQTKTLPIILVSARAEEESCVAGLATGADDYLIKPFSARELLARVDANLKMSQIRQEVARYEQRLRYEAEAARNQVITILESITDAFAAFDREWRYTYVNEQATQLLQKTREQLLGKHLWQEIFPEVKEQLVYREFHRAVNEQVAVVLEEFIETLGKWLEIHAYPSPDGLAVYFRDITARKNAELGLRESEEKFRNIVQTANEGVWLINHHAQTLYVNEQMSTMLGYSAREMIGKPVLDFCFPEDITLVNQNIQKNLDGNVDQFDFRLRRRNGQELLLLACTSPMRDGQGKIIGALGMFTNVTDRKRANLALRQNEERYRSLVAATSAVVWMTNALGAVVDLQPSWEEYTGQTWNKYAGWGWLQMIHPDDQERVELRWQQTLAEKTLYEIEARLWHHATGEYRYIIARAVPVLNADGSVREWIGTNTDIHERKQFEEERNSLLAREQAARAQAEEANRVKDEFLAILSHELRSPLNPILGWSRLLQTQKLSPDKTAEALATIERNAKLQTQLIDDLLDVSRILSGKLNLNITPVDLSFIIESAIETMQTAAVAKSIVIKTQLDFVGKVAGDSARLQQIVWNLLSNAIKFTSEYGQVSIKLQQVSKYAQITVSDTGKGIEPEFLPFVFDYFRQADASITRKFGGLGLGLAIVRHLIELHGGTVTATSPGEGLGATFTVMLPLLPDQSQNQPENQSSNSVLDLSGVRVLVVEDDTDSREFLVFVLEQYGATVIATANAAAGFEILPQFQPDVLISDIGMPVEDGYSLIRRIRAWETTQAKKIPAIALTAYAKHEDSQQALAAGFQKHLAKPVEPAVLATAVASILSVSWH
ncbi:PAS domain S-box protein [Nostoc sp. FACHB-110]|uniref:PAS domain S-box protein n=1 Tax=Nostoc sp. FACHB-110 TaxID=2692834 RepID=UPI0016850AA0|nr:PAS domain S-box protein [Nostoc sp. FACHB-110]MBD2436843.1 PAS domain S-box protein [Nostoc sp. FACHB-110]